MATARVNGIDLWYSDEFRIPPGGQAFVYSHGFAGPTAAAAPIFADLYAALAAMNIAALEYDIRGHGNTPCTDAASFSMPQYAADLRGLLDHLGIERAYIAGVSMGGMVSAQFACDYPQYVKALLLVDTTAGNQGDPATAQVEADIVTAFERMERIVREHGMEGLVERENAYRHERDPYATKSSFSLEEQDKRNARKIHYMTDAAYIAAAAALRTRPDLTTRTPSITAPTLVSCGEWDMFYPLAQRDGRLIPNARFSTVRGAAHDTPNFTPDRFLAAVMDFVRDVEAGRDTRGAVTYG
jgi:pimeloyl-ACP methyl ester carboxylesterase